MDRDIAGGLANIPVAEGIVGHKWTSMGTDENKEKFHNKAKDVDYNFAPELDSNVRDSIGHMHATETRMKKKFMKEIDGFKFKDATPKPFY